MDAVDIIRICLRRWYVMLPILLGAAGASYQLVQSQETTYTASASYGLVQPGLTGASDSDAETNPLGPGGNALVGEALEAQLNSRETQTELSDGATRGWGPGEAVNHRSYVVRIPQNETTYEVRAWGEDERAVRDIVDRVVEAAPSIADEVQARVAVPPSQRFQPFLLAPTQVEELPSTSGLKLAIAVMGVGLLMGAAWSVVLDRVLRWRRSTGPTSGAGPAGGAELPRNDASGLEVRTTEQSPPAPAARAATPRTHRGRGSGPERGVARLVAEPVRRS